jgi:hypothetical protein
VQQRRAGPHGGAGRRTASTCWWTRSRCGREQGGALGSMSGDRSASLLQRDLLRLPLLLTPAGGRAAQGIVTAPRPEVRQLHHRGPRGGGGAGRMRGRLRASPNARPRPRPRPRANGARSTRRRRGRGGRSRRAGAPTARTFPGRCEADEDERTRPGRALTAEPTPASKPRAPRWRRAWNARPSRSSG